MKVKKIANGRALYVEPDKIWIAQGMTFFAIDYAGKRVSQKYKAGNAFQKLVSLCFLSRQMLREGYHHMIKLTNSLKPLPAPVERNHPLPWACILYPFSEKYANRHD